MSETIALRRTSPKRTLPLKNMFLGYICFLHSTSRATDYSRDMLNYGFKPSLVARHVCEAIEKSSLCGGRVAGVKKKRLKLEMNNIVTFSLNSSRIDF